MPRENIKKYVVLIVLVGLTACARPYAPKTVDHHAIEKDCNELQAEMDKFSKNVEKYANDGWLHPTYILVLPAIVAKMRYSDAIEASKKRMEYIESVMRLKECYYRQQQAVPPQLPPAFLYSE